MFAKLNNFIVLTYALFLELLNLRCIEQGECLCLFSVTLTEEAVCPCFNLLSLLKSFCLLKPMEIWDTKPVYFYGGHSLFRNIAKGLFGNLFHRRYEHLYFAKIVRTQLKIESIANNCKMTFLPPFKFNMLGEIIYI